MQMVMGSALDTVSKTSSLEVVFTIASYIIGVLFYTLLIGVVGSIVASLNTSGQQYVEKLQVWRVSAWPPSVCQSVTGSFRTRRILQHSKPCP